MKIPYGKASFGVIRSEGYFYADKTPFIPVLEDPDTGSYLLLLRPRRAGKSLFLSMLASYYDKSRAGRFDELFTGLYIHRQRTSLCGKYFVLRLDFSTVRGAAAGAPMEASFLDSVRGSVRTFLETYQDVVPFYRQMLQELSRYDNATSLMIDLFSTRLPAGQKIYVLVDEYDSFANELLSGRRIDQYHGLVESTGFVRSFYKTIKAATGDEGPVDRVLITGVSPMALDDMASGFNIVSHVSLDRAFNAVCGFTRADVENMVDQFLAQTPELAQRERLISDLLRAYNGYLFSPYARERLCNPDMVLYFLRYLRQTGEYPQDLLDRNVRTDYGKLRQVASPPGGVQKWHKEIIETVITEGRICSPIIDRFGVRELYEPAHLISLLFFMGLLTVSGQVEGELCLEVPNLVMRRMHWEELTVLLREESGVLIDTSALAASVSRMAYHGELLPFLSLVQERVLTVLSNRDLMHFDEKHIKMILLSYLSLSPIYRPLSEKEMAQGYSDLFLALDHRYPDAKYAHLIELKHLHTGATDDEIRSAQVAGAAQIERYLGDGGVLPALMGDRKILAWVVVFVGAREHQVFPVHSVI